VLLKIYIYGYLNRVQSSRRLERECQRNVELMWLTGRLAPDFKTIADFRRDSGTGIRNVCRRFVVLCRELKLFSQALVAIDGSKFKAVNTRDRNFTEGKVDKRRKQIEESIQRYLNALETADRTQPAELEAKTTRLQEKIAGLREQMRNLERIKEQLKAEPDGQLSTTDPDRADFIYIARDDEYQCPAGERAIYRLTREERGMQLRRYWSSACPRCLMKSQCTPSTERRITRWEHESVLDAVQRRLDRAPDAMTVRRRTVEHVFGTFKHWMGYTHFLTRRLPNVGTEMSLNVLAYNLMRVLRIIGFKKTMKAMRLVGA
jgi:hypothetical protein